MCKKVLCLMFLRSLVTRHGLDVGKHTILCDGHPSVKFVKPFFNFDGQLKVARVDPLLLVIVSSCTSKIKDLSEVFHRASWVDGCVYSNLCAVFSILWT